MRMREINHRNSLYDTITQKKTFTQKLPFDFKLNFKYHDSMTSKRQLQSTSLVPYLVLLMSVNTEANRMYTVAKTSTDDLLCAVETPDKVVLANQTIFVSGEKCVPEISLCGFQCNMEKNCTSFNYKNDSGTCELFYKQPRCFSSIAHCTFVQVGEIEEYYSHTI